MATTVFFRRYGLLQETGALIRSARTLDDVLETLRGKARAIADADGVAIVRRVGDRVHYVGEDAIAPLWTGQNFPIEQCISGLAILERRPIVIPDVTADPRVPHGAYLSTFVKSMAMFPLGYPAPIAALGLYWKETRTLARDVEVLMEFLAQGANAAFEQLAVGAERAAGLERGRRAA